MGVATISVSHGWWDTFPWGYPEIVLHTGETIAYSHAVAVNKVTIDHYFDLLEVKTVSSIGLHLYSMQPSSPSPGKWVGMKGIKQVYRMTSSVKTQVIVLYCMSAAGCAIPPLILFQRSNLLKSLMLGEVPGTMYGLNSGWMDGEIFTEWFL